MTNIHNPVVYATLKDQVWLQSISLHAIFPNPINEKVKKKHLGFHKGKILHLARVNIASAYRKTNLDHL